MRISFHSLITALFILFYGICVNAQVSVPNTFTKNLSIGSSGTQVTALQQVLNLDPNTRVANTGPGSPGNETNYFGPLTKGAVVRFQEKYEREVLMPVGLVQGNGYVGPYTRAKLNTLSSSTASTGGATPVALLPATSTSTTVSSSTNYLVKESEKIDIYAGDKTLTNIQNKILAVINSAIASRSTESIVVPTISSTDVPSVAIQALSPQSGVPGTSISITGAGISSHSVIYFGSNYIVRAVSENSSGSFSFTVPPIPPTRYDIAVQTDGAVSNTAIFVVTDPRNPLVHLQSISPATISYGDTLTITGSGFSSQNNVVVTTYQKFTDVSSADGKTLSIQLTPENLQESAKIGTGKQTIPMSLYVVNEYGFSDSEKSFTMTL